MRGTLCRTKKNKFPRCHLIPRRNKLPPSIVLLPYALCHAYVTMKPYLCGLLWILRLFSVIIFSIDQGIFLKIENVHGNIIMKAQSLPLASFSQFNLQVWKNKTKEKRKRLSIDWKWLVSLVEPQQLRLS